MTWSTLESFRDTIETYLKKILGYIPQIEQKVNPEHPYLHPNITATYHIGEKNILTFGKIHPETAAAYEVSEETWYFDADFETLLLLSEEKDTRFQSISRFQSTERELNFVMAETVQTGNVASLIESEHPWIRDVTVDSIYQDEEKVGKNKKSVNFHFVLQSDEWTISDEEALALQNTLIEKLASHGYLLRQ